MHKRSIKILASVGMLLTAAIWGFAFVIVKNSLDFVPPIYMLAIRFSIAGLVLALIFCKKFSMLNKKILFHGAILGFFLFSAYAFQTIGCKYTSAGKNAFLTTIYVVLIPIFLWIMTKKRPGINVMIATFLAICGIGLLSLKNDFTINIGDILTLICGVGFALHIIFISRYNATEDPILLTVLQLCFAAIFSWILAPIMEGIFPKDALNSSSTVASMLYLGLISTMVAFFLQNLCQKYTPPTIAAIFLSMEAVFGVIFSCIFLKESLTLRIVFGCSLIFVAILLAELPQKKTT
ncbi:MAG: EamA family transporter [Spirochaetaceae bacterium]|nr:EamA family transporter [Spirochaetaceae bacterium]